MTLSSENVMYVLHQILLVLHCLLKVHPEDRYTYKLSFHWYEQNFLKQINYEKHSAFIIARCLCNYVSHNSPMCLMIGATGNEIVRLRLKFYINLADFYKFFHKQCSDEGLEIQIAIFIMLQQRSYNYSLDVSYYTSILYPVAQTSAVFALPAPKN